MNDGQPEAEQRLRHDFPGLVIESIDRIGSGWDNVAYLVNKKYVFRLPSKTYDDVALKSLGAQNQAEVALLKALDKKLPMVIPVPVYVAPDYSYFGYQHLPGVNMRKNDQGYKTAKKIDQFMELWLDVAVGINAVAPPVKAQKLGIKPLDGVAARERHAKAVLHSNLLSADVRKLVEYTHNNYRKLWDSAKANSEITMHADMGMSNWLLNDKGEPYALIDWSDACIAPPEHQLRLWVWYEKVDVVAKRWGELTGYKPDVKLIYLDSFADAIWDMGETIAAGEQTNNAWFDQCVEFLSKWSTRLPLL